MLLLYKLHRQVPRLCGWLPTLGALTALTILFVSWFVLATVAAHPRPALFHSLVLARIVVWSGVDQIDVNGGPHAATVVTPTDEH